MINNDRNDYSISYYANIEIKNNKNNTMIIIIIIIIIFPHISVANKTTFPSTSLTSSY